jgi:hypothetical protein
LPGTGATLAASVKRECILEKEPIWSEVEYTVKKNTRMMMYRTVVCVLITPSNACVN